MKHKPNWIVIFYLLGLLFLALWALADPNQLQWSVTVDDYCVIFTEHKVPVTWYKDGQYFVSNTDVQILTYEDFFKVLCRRWTKPFTYRTFACLAKKYKPWAVKPPIVEPNELPPPVSVMVWAAINSEVYHVWDKSCRYWRDTMLYIDVIEAMNLGKRPCSVCRPIFYTED